MRGCVYEDRDKRRVLFLYGLVSLYKTIQLVSMDASFMTYLQKGF